MNAGSDVSERSLSLERKLPLLMTGILAASLALALVLNYAAQASEAVEAAGERIEITARNIGPLTEQGIAATLTRARVLASDSVLVHALDGAPAANAPEPAPTDARVLAALERFRLPSDSTRPVELWTADGRRIAHVGYDLRSPSLDPAATPEHPGARGPVVDREGLAGMRATDSAYIGRLYTVGDSVMFWTVVPVRAGGGPLGWVAQQRRVGNNENARATIEALTGGTMAIYYANIDGSLTMALDGEVVPAAAVRDTVNGIAHAVRAGVGEVLTTMRPIGNTPIALVYEYPLGRALERPRSTAITQAIISLFIVAAGAAVSWGISRRITRPLADLTSAAERVAHGDYSTPVRAHGSDEVARLASSFNRMTGEIDASRSELRDQVDSARALASTLQQTNQRLAEANRQLEDAMREASVARADAEAASRAKSEFLAVMSHELRTPLNAIAGYTELLTMGIRGPVTDAQHRDLQRIRASQEHLLGLISAVLDLSRIESGRVTYQLAPVALEAFLADLDALVAPQAAAKSLVLERVPAAQPLAVLADREKLRQVVLNLLSNAVKFTPAGGRVTLSAEVVDERRVALHVADTGIGIDAEEAERIFEPFVQLDRSLVSGQEGVGLGLAISRDLARGMGGDLTVESRVGEGSRFTLTLARADADDATMVRSGEVEVARVET